MENSSVLLNPIYKVLEEPEGEASSSGDSGINESESIHSETVVSDDTLLEQVTLTNHLLVGIILFIGVFFGAFCMSHLYNRIKK